MPGRSARSHPRLAVVVLAVALTAPTLALVAATPALAAGAAHRASSHGTHRGPSGPPRPPRVVAGAAVLMDAGSGKVLWARDDHRRLLAASTTKILTAIVAQDIYRPNQVLTVPLAAQEVDGTRFGFLAGWKLTRQQLLQTLLLGSANDAAVTLAVDDPHGGAAGFVRTMRRTATQLGCTDSAWDDPSGLDAPGEGASPADLAILGRALLRRPLLAAIVAQRTYRFQWPPPHKHVEIAENHNLFVALGQDPGAIGVKAGYTVHAGETIVAAERHGQRVLIAVALHAPTLLAELADVRAMFAYGWRVHPAPGAPVLGLHAAPVPPQPLTSTGAAAATGAPPASYAPGLGVVTTTTEARSQRARVVAGPATVGGRSWIARDLTSDRLRTLVLGVLVLVLLIAAARVRAARRRRFRLFR